MTTDERRNRATASPKAPPAPLSASPNATRRPSYSAAPVTITHLLPDEWGCGGLRMGGDVSPRDETLFFAAAI